MKMKMIIVLLIFSSHVLAAPAAPGDIRFVQPNGESFIGELHGDEYFSWITDSIGRVIQFNPTNSTYEYANVIESNGAFVLGFSGRAAFEGAPLFASFSSNEQIGMIEDSMIQTLWVQSRSAPIIYEPVTLSDVTITSVD